MENLLRFVGVFLVNIMQKGVGVEVLFHMPMI